MELVEKIKSEIINESEQYKRNSADHYDFWNEHIKHVYEESIMLAEKYGADKEIVALGALLHDIALIQKIGEKRDHHINGAVIGENILRNYTSDDALIQKVSNCILHHRSSQEAESVEEICVADADILAHFDNIPMIFNSAFNQNHIELCDVREYLRDALNKDFNDLSEQTKSEFKPKYEQICRIILGDENK